MYLFLCAAHFYVGNEFECFSCLLGFALGSFAQEVKNKSFFVLFAVTPNRFLPGIVARLIFGCLRFLSTGKIYITSSTYTVLMESDLVGHVYILGLCCWKGEVCVVQHVFSCSVGAL